MSEVRYFIDLVREEIEKIRSPADEKLLETASKEKSLASAVNKYLRMEHAKKTLIGQKMEEEKRKRIIEAFSELYEFELNRYESLAVLDVMKEINQNSLESAIKSAKKMEQKDFKAIYSLLHSYRNA